MTDHRLRGAPVVERLLRWVLRAYPARFRDRFEREVIAAAREDLDAAVGALAITAIPARRAARVDPLRALRAE